MSATEGEAIARRVLNAFRRADSKYLAMSGGWRLHAAPEYFATVAIAKRIAKVDYVTLEQNIDDAIGWSGGRRIEANADNLSRKGRFDLAVWGEGNEGIKGVIEVKLGTWFTYAKVGGDVRRVCAALRRAPRLRWGMCAFHFACWREVSKPGAERVDDLYAKHSAKLAKARRQERNDLQSVLRGADRCRGLEQLERRMYRERRTAVRARAYLGAHLRARRAESRSISARGRRLIGSEWRSNAKRDHSSGTGLGERVVPLAQTDLGR